MVIFMFGYVAFFAISIGPLGWLVISEIFPQKVRGLGTSIGSLAVWIFNCIVSFTFFKIIDFFSIPGTEIVVGQTTSENPAGAFFLYGFIAVWVWYGGIYSCRRQKGYHWRRLNRNGEKIENVEGINH